MIRAVTSSATSCPVRLNTCLQPRIIPKIANVVRSVSHRRSPRHEEPIICSSSAAAQDDVDLRPSGPAYSTHSWRWRGHKINYATAGCGQKPVLLVHGFGASVGHYKRNIPAIAATHKVSYFHIEPNVRWGQLPLVAYGQNSFVAYAGVCARFAGFWLQR
jgi:hypothetical protein